eukprot:Pompholyxophrys_punicea_v1_NODE_512_length_1796_cov_6.566341.p1 type:complete len:182 gc:universal NODE_512_length_1796_cov_6.566341:1185-640(-)
MGSTTCEKTIAVLSRLFASFGNPERLVSDNGAQFHAQEFQEFVKMRGIRHSFSAPYYPATNGAAENMVKSFKRAYQKLRQEGLTVDEAVTTFLGTYRSTPHSTTGETPAKRMFGREIRTRLSLIYPSVLPEISEMGRRHFSVGGKCVCQGLQTRNQPRVARRKSFRSAWPKNVYCRSRNWW